MEDLEKMLSEVEASERQAWNWLEDRQQPVGDLHEYVTSIEHHKRQTSQAIAQLLQVECQLRQELNRKRAASSSTSDDVMLDDVSKSLQDIVGRLQKQHGSSLVDVERSTGVSLSSMSRHHSTGNEPAAAAAGISHRNQNGGVVGIDSDEGYSNSLQSDSLHGNRDAEPTTARISSLEMEVTRLTKLLDAYRWSHGAVSYTHLTLPTKRIV